MDGEEPTSIKIISYNILSSHLSEPDHYPMCSAEACSPQYRFALICRVLNDETSKGTIICLQEVSALWAGWLHTFFSHRNYVFVSDLYGHKFNGYMGCGLAFPRDRFELQDMSLLCVAEQKKWFSERPFLLWRFVLFFLGFFRALLLVLRLKFSIIEKRFQESDNSVSERRYNRIIIAKLKSLRTMKSFVVSTYHMPCEYMRPRTMTTHCILAAQTAQEFADDLPLVLCGDFNITPSTFQYKTLTTGVLDKTHPEYPKLPPQDNWNPVIRPMRSAYFVKNGKEPEFTNYAFTKDTFVGTLDYLFLSHHWRVKQVVPLPQSTSHFETPLPTLKEPSDHLCVGANLEFGVEDKKEDE